MAGTRLFPPSGRRRSRVRALLAAGAAVLAVAPRSYSADRFWDNPLGGQFSTGSNWQGSIAAGAGDVAHFGLTSNPLFPQAYTVTFAANAANQALKIEDDSVTFDLNGRTYGTTSPAGNEVGNQAGRSGRLTITDGTMAVAVNSELLIGSVANATGVLTVGAGGQLFGSPVLRIGHAGNGTLAVNSGGRATSSGVQTAIGFAAGSSGTVNVDGANSIWADTSSQVNIGDTGAGRMNVTGGGRVETAAAVLGNNAGSGGIVTVDGAGSTWVNAGSLTVGRLGQAELTVSNGATVQNTDGFIAANFAAATTGVPATVTVTGAGAQWLNSGEVSLGVVGVSADRPGTMSVAEGGLVRSASARVGVGAISVSGANSRWINSGETTVSAKGSLSLADGGQVSTGGLNVLGALSVLSGGKLSVLGESRIQGAGTVSGPGSRLTTGDNFTVLGIEGAALNVAQGAGVISVDAGVGQSPAGAAGQGIVNVRGAGSAWNVLDQLSVGSKANGALTVSEGALLSVQGGLTIGSGTFGVGQTIRGVGSVELNGAMPGARPVVTVGHDGGIGALKMYDTQFLSGEATIGTTAGSSGVVEVGSGGEWGVNANVSVGGTATAAGGSGTLRLVNGGRLVATTAGTQLTLWPEGSLVIDGGNLVVRAATLNFAGGTFSFQRGTVRLVDGSLTLSNRLLSAILGSGQALTPGRILAVPGTPRLTGALVLDGGTFSIAALEMAGGTITFNAGTFEHAGAGGSLAIGAGQPLGASLHLTAAKRVIVGGNLLINADASVFLDGGTIDSTLVVNHGVLTGAAHLTAGLRNEPGGRVRVLAGDHLRFDRPGFASSNLGTISLLGGTLESAQTFTNAAGGLVGGDGSLIAAAGIANEGTMAFSGATRLVGDVTNSAGGRIIASGGGPLTFFDDVANAGEIRTSQGGFSVFFGSLSGDGAFIGPGTVLLEGDVRPGSSPGAMSFQGNLAMGPDASLEMELAGAAPGVQYDRLSVGGAAALDGTLQVSLLNGFAPTPGQSFELLTAGSVTGTFASYEGLRLGDAPDGKRRFFEPRYNAGGMSLLYVEAFAGDANADGRIDVQDYFAIDRGRALRLGGWGNGDFDFSGGPPDAADYVLIDRGFLSGGGPLSAARAAQVPEPAGVVLAASCIAVAGRRRRRGINTGQRGSPS